MSPHISPYLPTSPHIDVINAMGGTRSQMHNILMHLRKCANHPYLFEGAEQPPFINDERLIQNSGKLSLLDKLLKRLHASWLQSGLHPA